MPDPETAIRVCNGLRTHLPLLAGLAANSPFWFGVDSGLASARCAMVRSYPGRGVPRAYRDFADYERSLDTTLRAAGMEDRTQLWWDVRPHVAHGTIEVREMDAQTELRDTLPIAALVHCLARYEAERSTPLDIPRDALSWSTFRAARDGIDAEILDEDGRVRPLREVARTLLSRLVMVAGELDEGEALEDVERLLDEGGGAERQRAEHARSGMDGLVRSLTERTLA
jgi:carboxylate-amine ligase